METRLVIVASDRLKYIAWANVWLVKIIYIGCCRCWSLCCLLLPLIVADEVRHWNPRLQMDLEIFASVFVQYIIVSHPPRWCSWGRSRRFWTWLNHLSLSVCRSLYSNRLLPASPALISRSASSFTLEHSSHSSACSTCEHAEVLNAPVCVLFSHSLSLFCLRLQSGLCISGIMSTFWV